MKKLFIKNFSFLILNFIFYGSIKSTLSYQDKVLLYQQNGSLLSFLYSDCEKATKATLKLDRHTNIDNKNWWLIINPDNVKDKGKIHYEDKVSLILFVENKKHYLYANKEKTEIKRPNGRVLRYYHEIYTQAEDYMNTSTCLNWGVFTFINPFTHFSKAEIDTNNPITIKYLEEGFQNKIYLTSTIIIDEMPEIWWIIPEQEILNTPPPF